MSIHSSSILQIDSSGRRENSVSRQLTNRLTDRYLRENPDTKVVKRDVADGLPIANDAWINANFTPATDRTAEQVDLLSLSDELVAELRVADTIVIGLPIYNFGVPASLKTWIDLVARAGETFRYTENGPEGLPTGKRAIVTVASGGVPVGSPADHATTYLSQVLDFMGISNVTYISATGLAMDAETAVSQAESQIDNLPLSQAA